MKKKASSVLTGASLPVLLCVASGESTDVMLRPFTVLAADGKEVTFVANADEEMKSPLDGETMEPLEGEAQTASIDDEGAMPVIATCECGYEHRTTPELAVAFDGVAFHCMHCASELVGEYAGDFEGEDESEDMPEDEGDSEELELDEDESEDESDEGVDIEEDAGCDCEDGECASCKSKASDEEDEEGEGEEEMPEDESEGVDLEDESEDEEVVDPLEDVEVATLATIDAENGDLRILRANSDRLEVFVGDTHVGRINLSEASDNVKRISANETVFNQSFSMAFYQNVDKVVASEENSLEDFGFKAAKVSVASDYLIHKHVADMKTSIVAAADKALEEERDGLLATIQLAMAGLNKSILEGPNMVNAFANTLRKFGVKNPEAEAVKVVTATAEPFLAAAYDHAIKIMSEGAAYAKGMSRTIESAQYSVASAEEEVSPEVLVAAAALRKPANPATVVASAAPKVEKTSFRSVFAAMGRR